MDCQRGPQFREMAGKILRGELLLHIPDSEEDSEMKPTEVDKSGASDKDGEDDQATRSEFERLLQQEKQTNSTNSINTVGTPVSADGPSFTNDDPSSPVNAAKLLTHLRNIYLKDFLLSKMHLHFHMFQM
ncbi:hypothetical protein Tco_1490494 [Tanacetum coccineum]